VFLPCYPFRAAAGGIPLDGEGDVFDRSGIVPFDEGHSGVDGFPGFGIGVKSFQKVVPLRFFYAKVDLGNATIVVEQIGDSTP
jgi:hypothetical protein